MTGLYASLSGILIFMLFSGLRQILPSLIRRPRQLRNIQEFLPLAETIVWILLVTLTLVYLITPNPLLGLVVAGILTGTLWYPLRNLFSGLILRFSRRYRPGQRITMGEVSGLITSLGPLTMEIEGSEGQRLILPYHEVSNRQIVRESPTEQVKRHSIDVWVQGEQSVLEAELRLRHFVLTLPWAVISREPKISLIEQNETGMFFRVVLYAFHGKYFPQMEQCVRQFVAKETA